MRRLLLLAALPLVTVPFLWAATGGGARDGSLAELRDLRAAPAPAARLVETVAVGPRRVSIVVSRAGGVEVAIRSLDGLLLRNLGHYTVGGRQRLVLAWDGGSLPPGTYVAAVRTRGETVSKRFRLAVRGRVR
jgi:hypothetical protein